MAYLSKYGTIWGQVPIAAGRIFWVAPAASYTVDGRAYVASNDNDGLSPERALLTLSRANALVTDNAGEVVVLLPGAHSWTGTTTISASGITITGVPGRQTDIQALRMNSGAARNRCSITASAGHVLTITGTDVEVAQVHIIPAAGYAGIAPSAAADRLYIHDCSFYMVTAADTATIGISIAYTGTTARLDDVIIRNCYWYISDNQGPAVRASGTCDDLTIESCTFRLVGDTAWDDAIEISTASLGTTIRDCDFLQRSSGTVITDCIDFTGATVDGSNTVMRCYFAVGSDPIEGANIADGQVSENYILTAAASQGGTLVLGT